MLLLDTHAFVWLASDQARLPRSALDTIRRSAGRLYLSAISALEIGILVKRGRLSLPVAPAEFVERALRQHGIQEMPVDRRIALASTQLPDIHNDPFDRIVIATAQIHDLHILSRDRVIPTYPDTVVVWD